MTQNVRVASHSEVPILDLSPLRTGGEIDPLAAALDRACRETGFFYIANHGVSETALNAIFGATRRIADLDAAEWRKVLSVNLDANQALLSAAHPLLKSKGTYKPPAPTVKPPEGSI